MENNNSLLLDSVTALIARFDLENGGISEFLDRAGFTSANGLVKTYHDLLVDAWKKRAKEFIDDVDFIEVRVAGYVEHVPLIKAQAEKPKKGYVYIITDGLAVKIGKSNNPKKRIDQIQSGNPRHIVVLQIIETDDMDRAELSLHFWYRIFRGNGEWFDLLPLFGLDQSDCIERALGAEKVIYDYSYSANLSTDSFETDIAKIWIRNPDGTPKKSTRNYIRNSFREK